MARLYQKNKGNPQAFSPDQCNELHSAIMSKATDLLRVYDLLIDQFRELSMITGWSFDPSVTAAAVQARLSFVKFKSIHGASDQDSKYQIVEAYLDGEAAASDRQAGGSVSVRDQELRISAPPGLLTTADHELLAKHKTELVSLLAPRYEDRERHAIQWESSAPADELDQALERARQEWNEIVLEDPVACEKCGEIDAWWDSWGNRHCKPCEPPRVMPRT